MVLAILLPFGIVFLLLLLRFALSRPGSAAVHQAEHPQAADRLRSIGMVALALAAVSSAWIYTHASADSDEGSGNPVYLIGPGYAQKLPSVPSKRDNYQMEVIGGKANVAMSDLLDWFRAQWRGRRLASTLLVLGASVCLFLFLAARFIS